VAVVVAHSDERAPHLVLVGDGFDAINQLVLVYVSAQTQRQHPSAASAIFVATFARFLD